MRLLSFLGIVLFMACGNGTTDCPSGEPVAVFAPDLQGVETHRFSGSGQRSEEYVEFSGAVALALYQSGCAAVTQDYTFTLPTDHPLATGSAAESAAALFYFLGGTDRTLAQYQSFGAAVEARQASLTKGRDAELVLGMRIKVDRLQTANEVIVRVVLSQEAD